MKMKALLLVTMMVLGTGIAFATVGPYGSYCIGDFTANAGFCFLREAPLESDGTYSIELNGAPNGTIVTGTVGFLEPSGYTFLSDILDFENGPNGIVTVTVVSDPSVFTYSCCNATFLEPPNGFITYNVGNVYELVSSPEPSSLLLLGSGLLGFALKLKSKFIR